MNLLEFLAIIAGNVAVILPLFLWLRAEGNADRREVHQMFSEMRSEFNEMRNEFKDFHGRMCVLEERMAKKAE